MNKENTWFQFSRVIQLLYIGVWMDGSYWLPIPNQPYGWENWSDQAGTLPRLQAVTKMRNRRKWEKKKVK